MRPGAIPLTAYRGGDSVGTAWLGRILSFPRIHFLYTYQIISMPAKPYKYSFIAIIFTALLMGCAGLPVQEMSNARQAVEAAREAKAETRAPQTLQAAEESLKLAEKALAEGDYAQARKYAQLAREQAVEAQNQSLNE
jgi:hypothetical protein